MSINHISAAELYEAVWQTPLKQLAQRWRLHPHALGNLCDKHGIPRPPSGYWTQKSLGKVSTIPALPLSPSPERLIDLTALKAQTKEKRKLTAMPLPAPRHSLKHYPLLKNIKKSLSAPQFQYEYLLRQPHNSNEALRMDVSPEQRDRAITLLHLLASAFDARKWSLEVVEKVNGRGMKNQVTIDDEKVPFRLRERLKQTVRSLTAEEKATKRRGGTVWNEKINMPSGVLQFVIESPVPKGTKAMFEDTTTLTLEAQLGHAIDALLAASVHAKVRARERLEREEAWAREQAAYQAKERAIKDEQKRISAFLQYFQQWQQAQHCREFIQTIITDESVSALPTDEKQRFIVWAEKIADHLDPLKKSELNELITASCTTNDNLFNVALSRLSTLNI